MGDYRVYFYDLNWTTRFNWADNLSSLYKSRTSNTKEDAVQISSICNGDWADFIQLAIL